MSTNVSASDVKKLRDETGLGFMDCKKALQNAEGDFLKAKDLLRSQGAKLSKLASRVAADGIVTIKVNSTGDTAVILEVNCETDFVAMNSEFIAFVDKLADTLLNNDKQSNSDDFLDLLIIDDIKLSEMLSQLSVKFGERLHIRRYQFFNAKGKLYSYVHAGKFAALVDVSDVDSIVGEDIAMHITAMKPLYLSKDMIPTEDIEKERKIFEQQTLDSKVPENVVSKIIDGKINKHFAELVLLEQKFIKDSNMKIMELVSPGIINTFELFTLGQDD